MVYFLFTALNWRFGPGFQRFTGDSQVIQLSKGTRGGLKRHRVVREIGRRITVFD